MSDRDLIENFFGDNKGVVHDLPSRAGTSRVETFNEELERMMAVWQPKLKYSGVWAEAELQDGYVTIYASSEVYYHLYGKLADVIDYKTQRPIIEAMNKSYDLPGRIEEMFFGEDEKTGIAQVTLRLYKGFFSKKSLKSSQLYRMINAGMAEWLTRTPGNNLALRHKAVPKNRKRVPSGSWVQIPVPALIILMEQD